MDSERAWSELPLKTTPEVLAFFNASTYHVIGDGRSTLFWEDKWINGEGISEVVPCILQLIPPLLRRRQTVREGLLNREWVRAISGGMS